MRPVSLLPLGLALVLSTSIPTLATERVIWQLGKVDQSSHEFASVPRGGLTEPVVVRLGSGKEEKRWPAYHPGSGNGAFGGRPHSYTLVFSLTEAPRGVFYLNLSVLPRQPRAPAFQLDINGHRGLYYVDPRLHYFIGDEDDAYNPIHAGAQRRIALPARYFRAGENRLMLTCLDDPAVVTHTNTAGGPGDSGFYYDALSLSQVPDTNFNEPLRVSFEPTVFYRRGTGGLEEECWLTVHYPETWGGGKATISLGKFTTTIDVPKKLEFGEARYRVSVPDGVSPGVARIDLLSIAGPRGSEGRPTFSVDFAPRRKWKVFYGPSVHQDIGYTDYQAKVAEIHARNIDRLLDVYRNHPDYRFNLDGSWMVEQWLPTRTPESGRKFGEEARAGRIGMNAFYGNFWTETLSLEELYRGLYFSKQLGRELSVPFDTAWVTDVPSYSWSLPSTLAGAGVRYFVGAGNQTRGPLLALGHLNARSPFWWEGPDGQRVLAWYSYHYHQLKAVFGLPPALETGGDGLARFLQLYEQADYVPDAVLLFGTEVDNVPADYQDAEFVERWNAQYAYPQIMPARFGDFFRYVEGKYSARLPVVRGDGGAYWEDSVGTSAQATGRYRQGQARVLAAEALTTLTATLQPLARFPQELGRDLWRDLLLYGEHTFTSFRSVTQPGRDDVTDQTRVKVERADRAASAIDELMRRGMIQLADLIPTDGENLVVYNPLGWSRSGVVLADLDPGTTLTDLTTQRPVSLEVVASKDGFQTVRFWAQDVPSLGYKVYKLGPGPVVPPGRAEPQSNIVQNRFYRVTLDPTRGAIKSIFDKELGRELVDASSPYALNEYLYVTGGGSEEGRGEGGEATQLTHYAQSLPLAELTVHRAEQGQIVSVEKTPWGHVVRLEAQAPKTPRIETEILLPDDKKQIEIRNHVQKELVYAKEAAYFAFPWAASNPTFRFDIANGWVNPEKDLLEGAASEWFAPQHWVSAEDGTAAITLAVVDAPLVSLGDINRGRWPRNFTKTSPTVFSYALNNYWFTNTPAGQSGDFVFRFAITSGASFDPVQATRLGREARSPLEVAAILPNDKTANAQGSLPPDQASLAAAGPENLVISAVKTAEDGQGLIVRVLETAGRASEGNLTLPLTTITSAAECNAVEDCGGALESDAHRVKFRIAPHQVRTIRVRTK
jgi:hypothetical protein